LQAIVLQITSHRIEFRHLILSMKGKYILMKFRDFTATGSIVLALLLIMAIAVPKVLTLPVKPPGAIASPTAPTSPQPRLWLVTGGQTGVDRATLDIALSLFLPVRGWCPKGRLAEDGKIPAVYPLQETTSTEYAVRTEWNVRDSDATMILAYGPLEGGTKLTADLARKYNRPALVLNAMTFNQRDVDRFYQWIRDKHIRILNVAGSRESANPGVIYKRAQEILKQLLQPLSIL